MNTIIFCILMTLAEPLPVSQGEWCPIDGIVIPLDEAARIASRCEMCEQLLILEQKHLAHIKTQYFQALADLDAKSSETLQNIADPGVPWGWMAASFGLGATLSIFLYLFL